MKRKHYVINTDQAFLEMMRKLRFHLNQKSDGKVIKRCIQKAFDEISNTRKVTTINNVKKINKDEIVNTIKKNFIPSVSVIDGFQRIVDLRKALNIDLEISDSRIIRALKSLGYVNKRTAKARGWLMKKI